MKTFSAFICVLMLTTLSAVAQDGPGNRLYRKYFSIKFSAKLYYKAADGEIVKMGSTSGKLSGIGQGKVKLVVGGEELPVVDGEVSSGGRYCSQMRPEKSPRAVMTLPPETLEKIMLKANPSLFKLKGTESKVAKAIKNLIQNGGKSYTIEGEYCTHNFFPTDDHREDTIYLSDSTTQSSW